MWPAWRPKWGIGIALLRSWVAVNRTQPSELCHRRLLISYTAALGGGQHRVSRPQLWIRRYSLQPPRYDDSISNSSQSDPISAHDDAVDPESVSSATDTDTATLRLRPYQEECIQECLASLSSGVTRIGVSSPTGSGKTMIFTHLIDRIPPRSSGGSRIMVIVNSIELAIQAANSITLAFPDKAVEIEQGSKFRASGFADVTVATYQTLHRSRDRLEKFDPEMTKAVIVDEAHHAAAKSYLNVLSYFDPTIMEKGSLLQEDGSSSVSPTATATTTATEKEAAAVAESRSENVPIIGFSATFRRHDGLALGRVFDRIVFHKDFLEMIKEKWLCPIRFTSIKADIDLSSVKVSNITSDFATASLASVVNTAVVNRLVLKSWIDRAYGRRKSTLIFAVNIEHVEDLTQTFREAGIDARYIHGGTPMAQRRQLLQDFHQGKFPVLVNCAILTEGADVPSIDCVLLARPTRSRNLFSQMIGRGMRLSPLTGKKDCLILDIVGNLEKGVICTPSLFGLDPEEIIEDESAESLLEMSDEAAQDEFAQDQDDALDLSIKDPTKVIYIDYDDPFQLHEAMKARSVVVETMSPNAWVDCGGQTFVLDVQRHGYVRVERIATEDENVEQDPNKPAWTSHYIASHSDMNEALATQGKDASSKGKSKKFVPRYRRPRHILDSHDLESAIRGSDMFIQKSIFRGVHQLYNILNRKASWRLGRATERQTKLVEKRLGLSKKSDEEKEAALNFTDEMTKGQAAVILTRLQHGAKGRWQQRVKASNRIFKKQEKEQARRGNETVQVGPLR